MGSVSRKTSAVVNPAAAEVKPEALTKHQTTRNLEQSSKKPGDVSKKQSVTFALQNITLPPNERHNSARKIKMNQALSNAFNRLREINSANSKPATPASAGGVLKKTTADAGKMKMVKRVTICESVRSADERVQHDSALLQSTAAVLPRRRSQEAELSEPGADDSLSRSWSSSGAALQDNTKIRKLSHHSYRDMSPRRQPVSTITQIAAAAVSVSGVCVVLFP